MHTIKMTEVDSLQAGDLIVISSYHSLYLGVYVKRGDSDNLHYVPIPAKELAYWANASSNHTDWVKKWVDECIQERKVGIEFINTPRDARVMKIHPDSLKGDTREYYDKIRKRILYL